MPYFESLSHLSKLMRLDKPVGTLLLLWPTLWSLILASGGRLDLKLTCLFISGVFLMRSAGCVINDIADRHVDPFIHRTRNRPLAQKKLPVSLALFCFALLMILSYALVLQCNPLTIAWAFVAAALSILYPFTKRLSHFPQFILGLAFSCSVLLVAAAHLNQIPVWAWILFFANTCWVLAYDTIYALLDLEDDLKIGVKSPAVYFQARTPYFIALMQALFVSALLYLNPHYGLSAATATVIFVYQQYLIISKKQFYKAFSSNNWIGLVVSSDLILRTWLS